MAETTRGVSLRRLLGTFLPLILAAGCLTGSDPADVAPDGDAVPPGDAICLNTVTTVDLQQADILDLQREFADGNLTSVALVKAYMARIEAFDNAGPLLNSIQAIHPDALAQAARLDQERANGSVRGPLHGVPILLKDNIGTVDQPTTAGSIALEKNVPPLDATLTARLRDAGVIPLAGNFDTPGPMGRNVLDVALVLGAIAGPDERDAATAAGPNHLPPKNDYAAALYRDALEGVRLGYQPNNSPIFQRALDDLESLGAVLVPVDSRDLDAISLAEIGLIPNEFKYGINWYLAQEAGPGLPVRNLDEIILYNQDHPDRVKYGQDLLIASDATPGVGPLADVAALPVIAANRALADDFFERNDVVAIVGHNAPFTGLGAAAGYPTVVVPAGYNGREPQGLSFFGPAWSEESLLAYAYAYEQASLQRVPPPTINPSLLDEACPDLPTGADDGPPAGASWTADARNGRAFGRRFTA